jgi:predicted phosphodiesterase
MRLAVLSDIHGNLTALEAALADLHSLPKPDLLWVLGDLAALGPRPADCIARVRGLAETFGLEAAQVRVIGGNTERYLVHGQRLRSPAADTAEAHADLVRGWAERDTVTNWCAAQLSFDDYGYLKGIIGGEIARDVEGYGWVIGYHGAPGDDELFLNPDSADDVVLDALLDREGRLGIGGHTHRPMDRQVGRWRVVNVGSVGMSLARKGYAQWGYFTLEDGQAQVDLRDVSYDVDAALADAQAAGYPLVEWWAARLR